MKKVIFLDRDGTIIDEPKIDQQVDDFSKLSFIPGVFKYLEKINNELGYDLVMVTNLSLIHISEPTRRRGSRMPSSA